MELGLGTGFQAQIVTLAMADDFLHHGSHLVDLDGEDDEMLALVVVFLFGFAEAFIGLLDAVVQYVGESQQHGCGHVACRQAVNHLLEIYLHAVLLGRHIHVSLLIDAEVAYSPALYVVQLFRVFYSPFLHFSTGICLSCSWVQWCRGGPGAGTSASRSPVSCCGCPADSRRACAWPCCRMALWS